MDRKWIPAHYLEPFNSNSLWAKFVNAEEHKRAKEFLLNAPNPKIIKMGKDATKSKVSLHFEVAVLFDKTSINKPGTSFGKFDPKNHSMLIYRWNPKAKIRFEDDSIWDPILHIHIPKKIYTYPDGAYYKWLEHKRSKPCAWRKVEEPSKPYYSSHDKIILAHLFFKTEEDFKKWAGEENYQSMFADLLE